MEGAVLFFQSSEQLLRCEYKGKVCRRNNKGNI